MKEKKIAFIDLLRVAASFFVIMIHITSVGIYELEIYTDGWLINVIFNSLSRWAVPLFFMVSGALFLDPDKQLSIKKLYTKNILHIAICIVVWGLFYSMLDQYIYGTLSAKSILIAIYGIATGNTGYHMWFLYTLVMLYIAVPIFRLITCNASKQQLEYALLVWIAFSLIVGQINDFAAEFGHSGMFSLYMPFVITGYGGYFLLGYYLMKYPLKGFTKYACCIMALLSLFIICGGKLLMMLVFEMDTFVIEEPLGLFSGLIATAIFTLAQSIVLSDTIMRVFEFLGQYTFGIYLMHVFFISLLYRILNIKAEYCYPVFAVLISSIGIFAVCFLISFIMSKIPIIRKLV